MDKHWLAQQLRNRLRATIDTTERERKASQAMATNGATAKEKTEDARVSLEMGALAKGQARREQQARLELSAAEAFHPTPITSGSPIALGALVEIEDEDSEMGRTFFLAPAGAGIELTMPGGDGYLSVVTPNSPVGRAAMGARLGDSIEVTVDGDTRYWEVTWLE